MAERDPIAAAPQSALHAAAAIGPPTFAFETVATRAIAHLLAADPLPKLVTVTAPPGYGKTVLLARLHQACRARGWRCLWLTLDDRDTDVAAVIDRLRRVLVVQGLAAEEFAADRHAMLQDRAAAVDGMARFLGDLQGPTLLCIDNLGFCDDAGLDGWLSRLIFDAGPDLHLVLSSTRAIPVDSVRAKLEVGAVELSARHLSFDRAATARLLEQAGIARPSEADLDRIVSHTEGWAAAVRLLQVLIAAENAAESAAPTAAGDEGSAPAIGELLLRFGGDHADIARILTRRVLVGFDPELSRFMVELSLVREFNADLASHMTGQASARAWLEMLVARNVLTFPLDSSRRWFRFHTLMREYLQAEAEAVLGAQRRRELMVRAAHWHEARGDHRVAIEIALEAGAAELAQKLLERLAGSVAGDRGQMGLLVQWVDRLAQAGHLPSLQVQAWYVWALADTLQYERARQALEDYDRRAAADPEAAGGALRRRLAFTRMVVDVFLDRLEPAYDQAVAWLSRGAAEHDALTVATVLGIAAITEIDRGDLSLARVRLDRARAVVGRSQSAFGQAWITIFQACVEIGQARPRVADELLRESREQVVQVLGADASLVVTMDFIHARAMLDLGRGGARELALRCLPRAMQHGIFASLEQGLVACVEQWGQGPDDAALGQMMDRVANCYPTRGPALLGAGKVRRLLALGRVSEAQAEAERVDLMGPRRGDVTMRERGEWLLAGLELQLALGACDAVLKRIAPALKLAREQGRDRDRIELLLIAADAHQRIGESRMATRRCAMAVVLAAPGKLVHPFRSRQGLLARLIADGEPATLGLVNEAELLFLDALRAADPAPAAPGSAAPPLMRDDEAPPAAALTARQIELLALLDGGLSNEQAADRLGLSVPTVKWHLHNAYVKLGVRGLAPALARARTLKLFGR